MGFIRGCLGLFVGVVLASLIASAIGNIVFGLFTILIVLIILVIVGAVIYKNQMFKDEAASALSKTLIGSKLTDDLIRISKVAPKLAASEDFAFRVVHSDKFGENFDAVLREYEGRDGETVESFEVVLVCEPANPLNPNAVAVTWFGFVMGYLAKIESAEIFTFINSRGGLAKANAKMKFDIENNASAVRVDIQKPFRFES